MKLIRFGETGKEKPGIVASNGKWLDCSGFGEDWSEEFLENNGLKRLQSLRILTRNSSSRIKSASASMTPTATTPTHPDVMGLVALGK